MRCAILTRNGSDKESNTPLPHWTDFPKSSPLDPWHQITSLVMTINSDTALSLVSILLTSGNVTDLTVKGYRGAHWDSDLDAELLLAAADDFWSALKFYGATLEVFKFELQDPKPPRLNECLRSFTSCRHLSILATSLNSFTPLASLPKLETLLVEFPGVNKMTTLYKRLGLRDLTKMIGISRGSLENVVLEISEDRLELIQSPRDIKQDVRSLKKACARKNICLEVIDYHLVEYAEESD